MSGSRPLLRLLGGLVVAGTVFGSAIAFASGLAVTPAKLTAVGAPTSVPPTSCSLTAVADSYVDGELLSSGSNFGTAATLSVRSSALGDRRSFVRFDLSTCAGLSTGTLVGATLKLFATSAAAGRTYQAHRVTAAWVETVVTWNNQPAVAGAATASTATAAGTMSWAVTADVSLFLAGTTNSGWRIADATGGAASAATTAFGSREHGVAGERPRLEIDYHP